MIIIRNGIIPFPGYKAIILWPFIFVRSNKSLSLKDMNHEEIHARQQRQLLIVGFFLLYAVFFLCRLLQYRNWHQAYRKNPFEREAYENQHNLTYLRRWSFWSWTHYICKTKLSC